MALTLKHITSGPVIVTRYLGPTDHRGSRIKATHKRDSETTEQITISWDYELNSQENHRKAAEQLLSTWDYTNDLTVVGCGWDHDSYYWLTSCPRLA